MSLSEPERAQLPPHPAGLVELTDVQIDGVSGGFLLWHQTIVLCTYDGCVNTSARFLSWYSTQTLSVAHRVH